MDVSTEITRFSSELSDGSGVVTADLIPEEGTERSGVDLIPEEEDTERSGVVA